MIYKISDQILSFLFISIQVSSVEICIAEMWEQNTVLNTLGIHLIFRVITEYNKINILYCSYALNWSTANIFQITSISSLAFFHRSSQPTTLRANAETVKLRLKPDYSD